MWCFQAKRCISAYLDDQLSPQRRIALEAHLAVCEHCKSELSEHQRIWQNLNLLPATPELPDDLWPALLGKLHTSRPPYTPKQPILGNLLYAACIVGCLIIGSSVGLFLSFKRLEHRPPADIGMAMECSLVHELFNSASSGLDEHKDILQQCKLK
jgi:predicted anti-sigma-YlaC factor YlaD